MSDVDHIFSGIAPGTPFTGSYTFDPAASDAQPTSFQFGQYFSAGTQYGYSVSIAGFTFSRVGTDVFVGDNSIVNNPDAPGTTYRADFLSVNGYDASTVPAITSSPSLPSGVAVFSSLLLMDPTLAVFASDLQPGVPNLSQFSVRRFELTASGSSGVTASVVGKIDSIVPEPATAMALAAIAALTGVRRKR